jgi:hypothetical protein
LFKASVHAEQPEQALSQHTPSATTPEVHSIPWDAGEPLVFFAAHTDGVTEVLQ